LVVEQAPEPAVIVSCMLATSFWPSTLRITNAAVLALAGQPSSKTTMDATTCVPCRFETS
jgi:hypothetical protein